LGGGWALPPPPIQPCVNNILEIKIDIKIA
jgi:hypothetical protein